MEFGDNPAEAAFRAEARAWLEAHAVPKGHPDDFSNGFFSLDSFPPEERARRTLEHAERCRTWQADPRRRRLGRHHLAAESGGRGGTPIQTAIFAEEQARFGVSNGVLMVSINMVGPTIVAHGTDAAASATWNRSSAASRSGASSTASRAPAPTWPSLRTRAVLDGDEWVVNGQKVWNSSARAGRLGDPARPHRCRRPEAPGDHLLPRRHAHPRHRRAPAAPGERRVPLQRGLPRRRAHPGRERARRGRATAGAWPHHPRQRAGHDRRRRQPRTGPGAASSWPARYGRADDPSCARGSPRSSHPRRDPALPRLLRARTALSKGVPPGPEASVMKLLVGQHLTARRRSWAWQIEGAAGMLAGTASATGTANGSWRSQQRVDP